ncbi:LD-carboxypeptidase [Paludibacterium purpuratum]|nr:LD-carboxypeptidase [Paludibacterium purpuratum]
MSTLLSACGTPKEAGEPRPIARLMALGGPMNDPARAKRGVDALHALGFEVDNLSVLARRHSRFAGTIAERAADLNALADPAEAMPELIVATRGGYGAIQVLEHLDFDRLCPRLISSGTVLMGYSDNTAAQLALLTRGGVVSWSGPMLYGDFAAQPTSAFTMNWLRQALAAGRFSLRVDAPQKAAATRLHGTLWGGNLTVLTSLVGTPWLPALSDGILFIEDVGEDVYKADRMLEQLRQAGILSRQRAILFGHFSGQRQDGYDPDGYTMDRLIERVAAQTGVPAFTGLPIGHVADIVPLPIGGQGELIADVDGFTLNVSGAPALKRLPVAWIEPTAASSL